MRARPLGRTCLALCVALSAAAARGQDYTIEPLKEGPPPGLAPKVAAVLQADGHRILNGGKAFADVWLRKGVPAASAPAGPKGAIQFPFLNEGELLGAVRFAEEGHDYRDQSIPKGVYTLRYGLQPVNGDHLGVSPYRDYALVLPAAKDADPADLAKKPLQERSAEAAGASHPTCLLLVKPANGATAPGVVRDEEKGTWGAVLPLELAVPGASAPAPFKVQLIMVGAAAA